MRRQLIMSPSALIDNGAIILHQHAFPISLPSFKLPQVATAIDSIQHATVAVWETVLYLALVHALDDALAVIYHGGVRVVPLRRVGEYTSEAIQAQLKELALTPRVKVGHVPISRLSLLLLVALLQSGRVIRSRNALNDNPVISKGPPVHTNTLDVEVTARDKVGTNLL